jgi:hypothetical protein
MRRRERLAVTDDAGWTFQRAIVQYDFGVGDEGSKTTEGGFRAAENF